MYGHNLSRPIYPGFIIVALPMVVIGLVARRWLVEGLTLGAVK